MCTNLWHSECWNCYLLKQLRIVDVAFWASRSCDTFCACGGEKVDSVTGSFESFSMFLQRRMAKNCFLGNNLKFIRRGWHNFKGKKNQKRSHNRTTFINSIKSCFTQIKSAEIKENQADFILWCAEKLKFFENHFIFFLTLYIYFFLGGVYNVAFYIQYII